MGFYINGTKVAEPAKGGLQITDEPVWNEDAGRDVNTGTMVGTLKVWKKTVAVTWPPLTFEQVNTILKAIKGGGSHFNIKYNDSSPTGETQVNVYPSNLQRTVQSISSAYQRQTDVTVTFIEW